MASLVFLRGRTGKEIDLVPAGALGFALPSLTFMLLDSLPAAGAGLAGGLFNAAMQTGGALAMAVFGALISGSFPAAMRPAADLHGTAGRQHRSRIRHVPRTAAARRQQAGPGIRAAATVAG